MRPPVHTRSVCSCGLAAAPGPGVGGKAIGIQRQGYPSEVGFTLDEMVLTGLGDFCKALCLNLLFSSLRQNTRHPKFRSVSERFWKFQPTVGWFRGRGATQRRTAPSRAGGRSSGHSRTEELTCRGQRAAWLPVPLPGWRGGLSRGPRVPTQHTTNFTVDVFVTGAGTAYHQHGAPFRSSTLVLGRARLLSVSGAAILDLQ